MDSRLIHSKNNRGQALFEFLIFLPFFLAMFSILLVLGASINGSINQQKAVRGYFFNLIKGSSFVADNRTLTQLYGKNITRLGQYSVGWRADSKGESPIAPCYKITSVLGKKADESCDDSLNGQQSTYFIRVMTMFGVCIGEFYRNDELSRFDYAPTSSSFCEIK